MSKIICDVCGTQYPDSAEQCPICGYAHVPAVQEGSEAAPVEELVLESRPKVRGGRFSKSNVRKRIQDTVYEEEIPSRKKAVQSYEEEDDDDDEEETKEKSGGLINVLLVIVVIALLVVSGYIFVNYFMPALTESKETTPTVPTGVSTEAPTEAPTTEVPTVPCTGLTLEETDVLLEAEGQMYLLNVVVEPEDTTDVLTFTSSDESIVTVNGEGRITAVGQGFATVTVTCGNVQVNCDVTCFFTEETEATEATEESTEPEETLKDVKLSVAATDVTFKFVGQQATFKLTCGLANTEVTWTSQDESIIKVDANGVATCTGMGKTTVIVSYGDQQVEIIVRCN